MKHQAIQGTARLQLVDSRPEVMGTTPPLMEFCDHQGGHPVRHDGGFVDDSLVPGNLFIQSSFLGLGMNFSNSVTPLYIYIMVFKEKTPQESETSALWQELCLWDTREELWEISSNNSP